MKKISLFLCSVIIAGSFMSCRNNGAKEYSGVEEKTNNSLTASVVNLKNNVFDINGAVISDDKIYYDYVNNYVSTRIYISESENTELYEFVPNFNYDYLSDCIKTDSFFYIIYSLNKVNYIAKVDENGNICNNKECESVLSVYLSDNKVFVTSFNSSEQLSVYIYDYNLEDVNVINLSEELCNQNEKAGDLKIDENGIGFLEIAYDIKYSGNEADEYKTKIIEFDILSLNVINTFEVTNGTDFLISEDSVSIISQEDDYAYVDIYSKTDGKYFGYNEVLTAEKIYNDCYISDNSVISITNNSEIFKPNGLYERIHHINIFNGKKVVITNEDKQSVNIICSDYSGIIENEYSFEVLPDYVIGDELSVKDSLIAMIAFDPINDKTDVITYSIESGEKWVSEFNTKVSQVEIFDSNTEVVLLKDDNSSSLLWNNYKDNEFKYEDFNLKFDQIEIFANNKDGVSVIGINGEKTEIFNINNEKNIIKSAELTFKYDMDSVNVINGSNDSEFFVISNEKIYEYSDGKLKHIADLADFNNLCDVKFIVPVDKDEFYVYGLDRTSYKFSLIFMKKISSEKRIELKIAVESGLESNIYDRIQRFNEYSENAYAVRIGIDEEMKEIADVYIYNSIYDIPSVLSEESCYDFCDYAKSHSSEYLSAAFLKSGTNGGIYKIVPAFSFVKYGENKNETEFNVDTEENYIKKLVIYQLADYIDLNSKLCNFHNEDFYSKIRYIKGQKQFSEFVEITELSGLIKDNFISNETVIVPEMYFTVVKSDKTDYAVDFVESFLSEEYQSLSQAERYDFLPVKKSIYEEYLLDNNVEKKDRTLILEMLNNSNIYYGYNKSLTDIIYNNIMEFSSDMDDYTDLADKIENNISLYIKERR